MMPILSSTIALFELADLPDADHQDHGDERHDEEGRQVGDDGEAEQVRRGREGGGEVLAGRVGGARARPRPRPCGPIGSRSRARRACETPKWRQQLAEVARPADRHPDVAHRVLDDQVPADDPGHQLAQRGIGVGVGRARDRHHGGELGVAERREAAGERGEQEREHDGGPGAGPERIADDGRAGGGEDAGADGGADAERGQVPLAERAPEAAALQDVVSRSPARISGGKAGS